MVSTPALRRPPPPSDGVVALASATNQTRQVTLKGSTMDPIALREFLHVLSLEYGGDRRGSRILASLPPCGGSGDDGQRATPPMAPLQAGATPAGSGGGGGGGGGSTTTAGGVP